jgi:hypothetical protein
MRRLVTTRRLTWWLYPIGLMVLVGSVLWAMHLPARLVMCADHAADGGVTCFYGDVVGRRIATIGVGLAIAVSICGLTFMARRSGHEED